MGAGVGRGHRDPVFEVLCADFLRPLLSLFLEPFEVTKPGPVPTEAGRGFCLAYLVSVPAPTCRARQTHWACEHLCVTKLGKSHAWQGGEALPQCGGTLPGTCCP